MRQAMIGYRRHVQHTVEARKASYFQSLDSYNLDDEVDKQQLDAVCQVKAGALECVAVNMLPATKWCSALPTAQIELEEGQLKRRAVSAECAEEFKL
jgi:hypothetical protein